MAARRRFIVRSLPDVSLLLAAGLPAGDQTAPAKRVLWTTSKVAGTPDPPSPYRTQLANTRVKLFEPLSLAPIPGDATQILVAERPGKVFVLVNDGQNRAAKEILNIGRSVFGIALHPRFSENGFLFATNHTKDVGPKGSRISRFKLDPKTLKGDPASETVILEWPTGGHNGGCIKFGPDGFLYIATGDGSGIADELQTGQDISDLLGSILRIDVDKATKELAYSIPADNPFISTPVARFTASYGHRQPWKFSFDTANGDLWAGEVGQDLWDMVHLVRKGGNYGWSVMEGRHPFRPERKLGPTPIQPPIVEHNHNDFRSVTGGHVYHGTKFPELAGAYIYADYDTGKIWSLRYADGKVTENRELADTALRIVEIGADAQGELIFVDFTGGQMHKLATAPPPDPNAPEFPRLLSETGLFTSTKDLTPAPGLIPYDVNAQLWSDHATKERYLAIPGDGQIEFDAIEYPQPAPGAPRGWRFPDNTVAVKTFSIEMERGNPQNSGRLETRILHFEQTEGTQEYGDQVWKGYTYVWNDAQTDAVLAPASGLDRDLEVKDKAAPGGVRKQVWHFPSRTECSLCHTQSAKFVLGLNTLQLNKVHNYGGKAANQLTMWQSLGLFKAPLPESPEKLPKLADYNDPRQSVDDRARSYLHSNCAHCHRKWGGGNAEFQLLSTLDLKDTGTVNIKPGQGTLGIPDGRLLVPGVPDRSLIYHRMTLLGQGRMPHVASTVLHDEAIALVRQWLAEMK